MEKFVLLLFFIGLTFLTGAYLIRYDEKRRKKNCVYKIKGKVCKYSTGFIPHYYVEYKVGSKTYTVKNAYNSVHITPSFLSKNNGNIHLDTSNNLYITLGKGIDREKFLKKIAPMNQIVSAYYSDENPEIAYVKSVPTQDSTIVKISIILGLSFAFASWVLNLFS